MTDYEIVSGSDIARLFNIHLNELFDLCIDNKNVIVYKNSVTIDGDLSLFPQEIPESAVGYIILGDLTVKGTIRDDHKGPGSFLYVNGDLKADSITISRADLHITANTYIKNFIYTYNELGSLYIKGDLSTKLLVVNEHDTTIEGVTNAIVTGDINSIVNQDGCIFMDIDEILNKTVLSGISDDRYIDNKKFMKAVKENKPFVKKEFERLFDEGVAVKDIFNDMDSPLILSIKKQVGKVVSKKKILTSLNLSDKKIRYLPDYLFGLDTITKLDLSENKLSSIPDDIEKLVNIKELSVSENNLQTLPSSICKLKALTVLDVSCNQMGMDNGSFLFPECIGQLINLTVLYGDYNKCFPLPESFSNLTALQTLSLFQCSDETPVDFPIQITALSNLRTLNIGSNSFREIPAAIANLTNLKYINLSSSLCYLKSVPDLSALKSLTILDASGARNFSGRPDPDPSIIASFFTAPNLVELNISGFKNKLEAGHLEGIGNLKKLEILDISSNNITKFPGEIFTLSSLKKLRAVNANIDRREIVKLTEFIPDIKIET